jgi:RsiW-degrading membrane proteinase PrsW (M82 family)
VAVTVGFRLVIGVIMVMRAMLATVFVVVHIGSPAMRVVMVMFVLVLVRVAMAVLMLVRLAVMGMFVRMLMSVVMRMQMLVFVFSFHSNPPCPNSLGCRGPS